jgi:hypothetical protein
MNENKSVSFLQGGGSVYSFQRISAYQETAQLIGFSSDKGGDGKEEDELADARSKPLKPIFSFKTCWLVGTDFTEQILC